MSASELRAPHLLNLLDWQVYRDCGPPTHCGV